MASKTLVGVVVLVVAIQLVPVSRTNPPVVNALAAPPDVMAILKTSCYDCHSNETVWPWYAYVAPVSWLVAHDVDEGREHLNFSDITAYEGGDLAEISEEVVEEIAKGEMPLWFYVPLHEGANVTRAELEILAAWAESHVQKLDEESEHEDDAD